MSPCEKSGSAILLETPSGKDTWGGAGDREALRPPGGGRNPDAREAGTAPKPAFLAEPPGMGKEAVVAIPAPAEIE